MLAIKVMGNLDINVNVNMQVNLRVISNVNCNMFDSGYARDIRTYPRTD